MKTKKRNKRENMKIILKLLDSTFLVSVKELNFDSIESTVRSNIIDKSLKLFPCLCNYFYTMHKFKKYNQSPNPNTRKKLTSTAITISLSVQGSKGIRLFIP